MPANSWLRSMRIASRHPIRILSNAFVVLAVVAGPVAAAPASRDASGRTTSNQTTTQTTSFTVTLTSQQTVLEKVGAGGEITYGWNQLSGTAPSASARSRVLAATTLAVWSSST